MENERPLSDEEEGGSGTENNIPTASHNRQHSESDNELNKRQCTLSTCISPGVTAASPPKFVSLEEIMSAAKGMSKMALAHEIAMDKDFRMKQMELPEKSLLKNVKDTITRAYWDLLRKELNAVPPVYKMALLLLNDVKEALLALLLPQHKKLKEEICEVLDSELIEQQAENGVVDFQYYAQFVVSVMAKICAPIRDDDILALKQNSEPVSVFKSILEVLALMNLDMANFAIAVIRPEIVAHGIEYEKMKFAELLKIQSDGLAHTREWLKRNQGPDESMTTVISKAFIELLKWDSKNSMPETLMMDASRFMELGDESYRLSVAVAALLVTTSTTSPSLQSNTEYRNLVKQHVVVLLSETQTQTQLEEVMVNVAEQVIEDSNNILKKHGFTVLNEERQSSLRGQIIEIGKRDHRIRSLVFERICEFLNRLISSSTAAPLQIPPGLSSFQPELASLAGRFLRLVSHNRDVFGEYYTQILT